MDHALNPPQPGRTVFVLTYRWPPQGGGGVQRTLKLVKYLVDLGWRPVIHTVSNPYSRLWDPSLESEVPAAALVHRTPTLEYESLRIGAGRAASGLIAALRGTRASVGGSEGAGEGAVESVEALGSRAARRRRGRVARIEDWIWSRLLVPDPQIVWAGATYFSALRLARRERADVIYSTSPPNSVNVLALSLARRLQLPWVADFRDPWTDGLRRRQWYPDHPARQRREERWERSVFEQANCALVTTGPARETFLEKYSWCSPDRVQVLTNGFDSEDFPDLSGGDRLLQEGRLHVTLSGNIETMFDLGPFLRAVRTLVRDNPAAREVLRVNFLGTKRQALYDAMIQDFGIEDVVQYHAYMPHERVVRMVSESDVLMLCQIPAKESGGVKLPGKMFEYLYTRKPILALTIPGETTAILKRTGLGHVVDPFDESGICAELTGFIQQFDQGGVHAEPNEDAIRSFDRKAQAQEVSDLLDRAVREGRRPSS